MDNYSIVECNNCGEYKLLPNSSAIGGEEYKCTCGVINSKVFSIVNDKFYSFTVAKA